jgi:hypothetical protein
MTSGLPVAPELVVLIALLNPVVIAVAAWMGSKADQPQKILIAAFAASLAGVVLIWLLAELRFEFIAKPARAAAGIFVLQFLFGLVWAALGYRFGRKR